MERSHAAVLLKAEEKVTTTYWLGVLLTTDQYPLRHAQGYWYCTQYHLHSTKEGRKAREK